MPETPNQKLLSHFAKEAVKAKIDGAAISLCDITRDPKEVFSGTAYREGRRLYVITCNHALRSASSGKLWIVRRDGSLMSKGFPGFVDQYRPSEGWPDIAVLELSPDRLNDYLVGVVPIGPEDIGTLDYSNRHHELVTLVGNTAEDVDYRKIGKGEAFKVSIVCLFHEVTKVKDWPAPLEADEPNDTVIDIYMKSIKQNANDLEAKDFHYAKPYGLSGGGIWAATFDFTKIWTPSQFKLVGVQARWNKVEGFLRGIQIQTVKQFSPLTLGG